MNLEKHRHPAKLTGNITINVLSKAKRTVLYVDLGMIELFINDTIYFL